MGPKKGPKWSNTKWVTILDPVKTPFGAKKRKEKKKKKRKEKEKKVNHVIVKISTLNSLLCFLIIVPLEFRVGRRCVRYGVGQEHGQQIL